MNKPLARVALLFSVGLVAACGAPTVSAPPPSSTPALSPLTAPSPSPAVVADVPQFRGDAARTGVMAGPIPASSPVVRWTHRAGGAFTTAQVIGGGLVFAASDDGVLAAVDIANGTTRWSVNLDGTPTTPALAGGNVIVGSSGGSVLAFDARSGSPAWSATFADQSRGAPAVTPSGTIVSAADGTVLLVDPGTGRAIWRSRLDGRITRSPAVAGDTVVVPVDSGLAALDLATGAVRWTTSIAGTGGAGSPSVADGRAYAAMAIRGDPSDFGVAGVDMASGTVDWRYASPNRATVYTPALADGRAFAVEEGGLVVALDAGTGDVAWTRDLGEVLEALPAIAGDTLLVGRKQRPRSGHVHLGWSRPLDAPHARRPICARAGQRPGHRPVGRRHADRHRNATMSTKESATMFPSPLRHRRTRASWAVTLAIAVAACGSTSPAVSTLPTDGPATPTPTPAASLPAQATSGASTLPAASVAASSGVTPISVAPVKIGPAATVKWQSVGPVTDRACTEGPAVDPKGRIWAMACWHNQAWVFKPDGTLDGSWQPSEPAAKLDFIYNGGDDALADTAFASDGSLFIVGAGNRLVEKFGPDRKFVLSWGGFGPGDGKFAKPMAMGIDARDNVYVADAGRHDVQVFEPDGTFVRSLAEGHVGNGAYLVVTPDGHVYVNDPPLIREYGPDGTEVAAWDFTRLGVDATPSFVDAGGHLWATAWQDDPKTTLEMQADGSVLGAWPALGEKLVPSPDGKSIYATDYRYSYVRSYAVPSK